MILVTDIDWNLEGSAGMPCDYGLPDMVEIAGFQESLPYDELSTDVYFYLEDVYGFSPYAFRMKVLENNKERSL